MPVKLVKKKQSKENNLPIKFVAHSYRVLSIAVKYGWKPAARYTNMRDVKKFNEVGFIDIEWKNYNFEKHLEIIKKVKPAFTVAQDILKIDQLDIVIDQAHQLSQYSDKVIVVPKDPKLAGKLGDLIPPKFMLGFSVPTKYGGTEIAPEFFDREVHLLGGRPDVQRKYADRMNVISIDCNRFTLDASFGDYFDGEIFRPHPQGGYEKCIRDSLKNINKIWRNYRVV